jgi:hypothetical protein
VQTLYFTRALGRIVKDLKANELISFLQPFVSGPSTQVTESQKGYFL